MNGYVPADEACKKAGITLRILNRLIAEGQVRVKDTSCIQQGRRPQIRYVVYQDILDAQAGVELSYIALHNVSERYGISPRAVRHQIEGRRVRWRRVGAQLQPCAPDLDMLVGKVL